MDIRQLKHVHAIVEFGGFGRAATALNISQSALTQSIGNLERELGINLFERTQSGAKTTAAGALLLNRSELILMEFQRATLELKEVGGATPEVRIGIDKNLSSDFISGVISGFLATRRHAMLEVRERWSDELAPALARGELDLIVACLPSYVDDYNMNMERLFDKTIRALVRSDHPVLARGGPTNEDLSNALWGIRAPGLGGTGPARAAFTSAGIPIPQKIVYTDSTDVILSLVRSAEMIGFLCVDLVQKEIDDGSIVALSVKGLVLREPVYVAHHARSKLKPVAAQFKAAILRAAQSLDSDVV